MDDLRDQSLEIVIKRRFRESEHSDPAQKGAEDYLNDTRYRIF